MNILYFVISLIFVVLSGKDAQIINYATVIFLSFSTRAIEIEIKQANQQQERETSRIFYVENLTWEKIVGPSLY